VIFQNFSEARLQNLASLCSPQRAPPFKNQFLLLLAAINITAEEKPPKPSS
jgi:hypothetical protein